MPPPEQTRHRLVQEWRRKANEDFAVAEYLVSSTRPYYGAVGFHAQQAAEKYLKAFLVHHQIEFPKTHDLDRLLDLMAGVAEPLANLLRGVVVLNAYGVETRYPADLPELTLHQAQDAVELATTVRDVVCNAIGV